MPDDFESHADAATVPPSGTDPAGRRRRIEPPPRAVLDAARRREPAALEAFFDAYFEPIHALAWRLLGDRTQSEDVTQEVLLKIHRALDRLDPDLDPWPWIATIVHNACRDLWRSSGHRMARRSDPIDDATGPGAHLASPERDPERAWVAAERERAVRAAIARLPEQHRQVLLLHDYDGLSHLEVAEMLGIGHAAVRKRHSRALEALGAILRESAEPRR